MKTDELSCVSFRGVSLRGLSFSNMSLFVADPVLRETRLFACGSGIFQATLKPLDAAFAAHAGDREQGVRRPIGGDAGFADDRAQSRAPLRGCAGGAASAGSGPAHRKAGGTPCGAAPRHERTSRRLIRATAARAVRPRPGSPRGPGSQTSALARERCDALRGQGAAASSGSRHPRRREAIPGIACGGTTGRTRSRTRQ
jgi:hypothetical protein